MRKLFINISIVLILILSASLLLNKIIYPALNTAPWSWGSPLIYKKEATLKSNPDKYNTLFIGSSRVYRHVNPAIIDSTVQPEYKIRSFNMGANWLFAPESFYVYEQLLNNDNFKFKYVIMELSKIPKIDYHNLHTSRIKYWFTFSEYVFSIKAILASNVSYMEKAGNVAIYTISFLGNLINLGYITEVFSFRKEISNNESHELGTASNGFLPFNTVSGIHADPNIRGRHQKLLSDTTVLGKLLDTGIAQCEKFEKNPSLLQNYNYVFAERINNMIRDAKKRDIHLIFLFTPKLTQSQYEELIPLFHHIDPAHKISFADGRRFSELYQVEYAFDLTHFNEAGANRYSKLIAEEFDALLGAEKR